MMPAIMNTKCTGVSPGDFLLCIQSEMTTKYGCGRGGQTARRRPGFPDDNPSVIDNFSKFLPLDSSGFCRHCTASCKSIYKFLASSPRLGLKPTLSKPHRHHYGFFMTSLDLFFYPQIIFAFSFPLVRPGGLILTVSVRV
jgi:hypothetical protein